MNICVIIKQTFDTEEKIVVQEGEIVEDGVKFIINPYDEYAIEEAVRQKEQHGGKIVVVSVGPDRCKEALRTALAMGADEAVHITDDRISSDEYSVSKVLAAYIEQHAFELVLAGNFSVDNGAGQVAIRVARLLNIPHTASITSLDITEKKAIVQRDSEGDTETVEVTLPALFTAQQGLNEPRYPSLPGIMKAKRKPLEQINLDDLGLKEGDIACKTERVSVFLPPERQDGQILQGDMKEQVKELVRLLRTESTVI